MKRHLSFLFILAIPCVAASQNKLSIDSLLHVYQTKADDTLKLRTINNIVNYYMYREIEQADTFARKQLELARVLNHDSGIALATYQLGSYHYNLDQSDSAVYYYEMSLELAKEMKNAIYISQALRGLAIIAFSKGDLIKTDSINDLDLSNCIQAKDSMGMALAYDFKGTINQNKGYYSIALNNVLKGLGIFELLKDSIRIADCYNHLATLEMNLENFENAIKYNEIALRIYEGFDDIYYQAQALNDIGVMYKALNQEETALSYFDRSIEKSQKAKVKAIEAAAVTNIGATYLQMNRLPEALDYLKQSLVLSNDLKASRRIAIAENRLAEVYIRMNNPEAALKYAANARSYAEKNENISIKLTSINQLATAYEKRGDISSALVHLKEAKVLSDSILNKEKINTIEELRISFELARKEAAMALQEEELKLLKVQAKNDRLTKVIYGTGMFSLIVIAGLLFFGLNQRIKKNQIRYQNKEALLTQEIEFKKKELTSQTLHLVKKNTFIQELKGNLERLKKSPELFKVEFRRLILLLKKENAENEDWEVFKSYFSEVHNDFDRKLKEIHPHISEKEIRLASFLRMNLSTKEIASIFSVMPDSVLKSKYRLKQKLKLDKEADLLHFLNSI